MPPPSLAPPWLGWSLRVLELPDSSAERRGASTERGRASEARASSKEKAAKTPKVAKAPLAIASVGDGSMLAPSAEPMLAADGGAVTAHKCLCAGKILATLTCSSTFLLFGLVTNIVICLYAKLKPSKEADKYKKLLLVEALVIGALLVLYNISDITPGV